MGRKSIFKGLKIGQSIADLKNLKSFVRLISTIWRNHGLQVEWRLGVKSQGIHRAM